jgi:hypothetical protein
MITDRFLRNIWAINGVIFLGFFILLFIAAAIAFVSESDWFRDNPDEIIVGEKLEEAKEKGLALQGIEYGSPARIYGSDHYLLTVSPKTYETPKEFTMDLSSKKVLYGEAGLSVINVIFLDSHLNVTNTLTDKKIFISEIHYPSRDFEYYSDTVQRHISYKISTADTNNDESINALDDEDLYISDLDGKNLRQITKGVNVVEYSFENRNQILIQYTKRNEEPEEHKRAFFAIYSIKENKLEDLTSLENALDNVERILAK